MRRCRHRRRLLGGKTMSSSPRRIAGGFEEPTRLHRIEHRPRLICVCFMFYVAKLFMAAAEEDGDLNLQFGDMNGLPGPPAQNNVPGFQPLLVPNRLPPGFRALGNLVQPQSLGAVAIAASINHRERAGIRTTMSASEMSERLKYALRQNSAAHFKVMLDLMNETQKQQFEIAQREINEQQPPSVPPLNERQLLNLLWELLTCNTCHEVIRCPPIYCCNKGHLICSSCSLTTLICSTCRASLSQPNRSITSEKLVLAILHACSHYSCTFEAEASLIRAHEQTCSLALVACPTCKKCMIRQDIRQHFDENHKALLCTEGQMVRLVQPVPSSPTTISGLKTKDAIYVLNFMGVKIGDDIAALLYIIVLGLGSVDQPNRLELMLRTKNRHGGIHDEHQFLEPLPDDFKPAMVGQKGYFLKICGRECGTGIVHGFHFCTKDPMSVTIFKPSSTTVEDTP